MRRASITAAALVLGACASSPRTIEVVVDNQLSSGSATLWVYEIFNGFPLVSIHATAHWQAPVGRSVHRIEACLPVQIGFGELELTSENADLTDKNGTLHFRMEVRPPPEGGWMPRQKKKGEPGVVYNYDPPPPFDPKAGDGPAVERFSRALEQAGSRKALGCWGDSVFAAIVRANR